MNAGDVLRLLILLFLRRIFVHFLHAFSYVPFTITTTICYVESLSLIHIRTYF